MLRRSFKKTLGFFALIAFGLFSLSAAHAADDAPDILINSISSDMLVAIKADPSMKHGNIGKLIALVDLKIIPFMDFKRMTASAVGSNWRQATPEQQNRLQNEFKKLLVRTYAGALSQVSQQTVIVKPLRSSPDDKEVIVRTEVRGGGKPIQLDYRLEKTPDQGSGWKIYNINVMGIWLIETYRSQFTQEIGSGGIDGLIASLTTRNGLNGQKD